MSDWPSRIGILGAGALGTLVTYQLQSHTSHEVWLFARRSGLKVIGIEGEEVQPVQVSTRPETQVDLLIVLVKAYATAEALRWAAGAIGPETVALTLQNGIGNAEVLAGFLGPERVLVGTTAMGATRLSAGQIRRGGSGPTLLSPWQPGGLAAERAPAVAGLLSRAGLPATVSPDARTLLWSKLVINCGINALTAILRVPNGDLLQRPAAERLMRAAAAEVVQVAAAAGIQLPGDPAAQAAAVAAATGANRSSMLQDIEAMRRTEIDAINGAVVAWGERLGVATPVNLMLTELVRALEGSDG